LGPDVCSSGEGLSLEWLETDGAAGYASSTILCANTRRYHGLLVAPVPGYGRHVFLSWLEEWVEEWIEEWSADWYIEEGAEAPERGAYLSCALFSGGGLWPPPLTGFERGLVSTFHYTLGGLRLKKQVVCLPGRRGVAVSYEANLRCRLKVRPFFACRPFHALTLQNPRADLGLKQDGDRRYVQPYAELPPVYLSASGRIDADPGWYLRFYYPEEEARGFDSEEDLLSPGTVRLEMEPGRASWLVAALSPVSVEEAAGGRAAELARRSALVSGREGAGAQLALAADQFVIGKGAGRGPERGPSAVAGYPWFEEWGRDLLISLPGLLLVEGRVGEAVAALKEFGAYLKEGLLPNRLLESGAPDYNCADAPLWYLLACQRVAEAGGLAALRPLWPTVAAIVSTYGRGSPAGIAIAEDGLPTQGAPGMALTWMDACVAGQPVTPRAGKAVELAALWHTGLRFAAQLAAHLGHAAEAATFGQAADRVRAGFEPLFWNEERGCCHDVIGEAGPDPALRPNQLFAVGLPWPLLTGERAESLLAVVERHLLTPRGLRSLAPIEPGYAPHYGGGVAERDRAYHQGTSWPWLLGIYTDAVLFVRGEAGKAPMREAISQLLDQHLKEAGVGSVSEMFEAEGPHAPRGCIAQAWSVAELRRALARLEA
jgi:predicted glycogen debranching enzyme